MKDFHCQNCDKDGNNSVELKKIVIEKPAENGSSSGNISLNPIGVIRTEFFNKTAVPRQPSLGSEILGKLEISLETFTNPEHSLEGLEEFSHLWILYHFHKNQSHPKAKVAPPRLNGGKVGVFSCRSPHRPCPIGLSLVRIDKIENSTIYFYGTDMIDGTPVFDVKPYIPDYDSPALFLEETVEEPTLQEDLIKHDFYDSRQAPDGAENLINNQPSTSTTQGVIKSTPVKIANWVSAKRTLKVFYSEKALTQITDLDVEKKAISSILSSDPRSVYLRTTYGSQFYTFRLGDISVTSKFDDQSSSVMVLNVNKMEEFHDLGKGKN